MYSSLTGSRFARFLLLAFAALVAIVIFFHPPTNLKEGWSLASGLVGTFLTAIGIIFGPTFYWAPWRFIWRLFPALENLVYPDLNGIWLGTTKSNWPIVEALFKSATGDGGLSRDQLDALQLKSNIIAVQIRASLFSLSVMAKVEATQGLSKSIGAAVKRDENTREFDLSYTYIQETPDPVAMDESTHTGAAILKISGATMAGPYWTRRSWKQGLNTAGLIELKRVSARHINKPADLIAHARSLSGVKSKHAARR